MYELVDWILHGVTRSMAVSNGQFHRLPWESVLWGLDALLPSGPAVHVPESLLVHGRSAREVMARVVGERGPSRTWATMQHDVGNHDKDILEIDRLGFFRLCS